MIEDNEGIGQLAGGGIALAAREGIVVFYVEARVTASRRPRPCGATHGVASVDNDKCEQSDKCKQRRV